MNDGFDLKFSFLIDAVIFPKICSASFNVSIEGWKYCVLPDSIHSTPTCSIDMMFYNVFTLRLIIYVYKKISGKKSDKKSINS